MKKMRMNVRRLIPLMTALFLLLGAYGAWNLAVSGRRWFSHSGNAYARQARKDVTEGSVLDTNGVPLAYTAGSTSPLPMRWTPRSGGRDAGAAT